MLCKKATSRPDIKGAHGVKGYAKAYIALNTLKMCVAMFQVVAALVTEYERGVARVEWNAPFTLSVVVLCGCPFYLYAWTNGR